MSIVSNPYSFSITINKTFKTDALEASTPGTQLGPYKYALMFRTRTNGVNFTIDNTSSKYLSIDYDCYRVDDQESYWEYTLYLTNGKTENNAGYFRHSSADPADPEVYFYKLT